VEQFGCRPGYLLKTQAVLVQPNLPEVEAIRNAA
jgi:hypothetical protein